MPSGAKGRNVYQGSLAVQQALEVDTGDVGRAGGEPSASGTLQSCNVTGEMADPSTGSGNPPVVDDDDIYGTPPPPTPSPSKRRFSAVDSTSGASQFPNSNPDSESSPSGVTSTGTPPISRSLKSSYSSAKRGKMTGAIAISNLGHEVSDIKTLMRQDIELAKSQIEARNERKRQDNERLEQERQVRQEREHQEREHLEQERQERERLERERLEQERQAREQQNPIFCAITRMQEVDSDLPPEDQVTLADLFNSDLNSASTYLLLKADPVRKAWIKRKLAQATVTPESAG